MPPRSAAGGTAIDNSYNAHHLLVLEGLEAVRKRPGMYIGSTDTRGLMHCVWEIIDNGVDEALAGVCRPASRSCCTRDGSVEVADDGRGIPVDKEPKTGLPGVEVIFTKLHAGGKFGGGVVRRHRRPARRRRLGGQRALLAARRRGRARAGDRAMSFQRGVPGVFDGRRPRRAVHAGGPACAQGGPGAEGGHRHPRSASGRTGRSSSRTPRSATTSWSRRARQTSFLVPGLELRHPRRARRRAASRRPSATTAASRSSATSSPPTSRSPTSSGCRAQDTFTETVPLLDDNGHMTPQDVERDLAVDVALRWGTGYDTELRSFVNIIATPKGGTHVAGLRAGPHQDVQRRAARRPPAARPTSRPSSRTTSWRASRRSSRCGSPSRSSRARPRRCSAPRRRAASSRKVVAAELKAFLDLDQAGREAAGQARPGEGRQRRPHPDRRPQQRDTPAAQERPGVQRAAGQAGRLPLQRRRPQRAVHRRGRLGARHGRSWPATRSSRRCCRSAARSSTSRRRPSATCSRTPSAPRSSRWSAPAPAARSTSTPRRYGRIIFMADADSDGAHIRCLLTTLFFSYMRRLVAGRPGLHGRAAAAPHRAVQPQEGHGQVRLHLLRPRAAAHARRAVARRGPLEGPDPALQGPRRDGRQPAGRDHHGPAAPHAAPDHASTTPRRPPRSSSCSWATRSAPRKEFIVQGAYEVDADAIDA